MKWHKEEGLDYYKRTPKKPKHLKGLLRLDCYVLMRLRSGTDKRGHKECKNTKFRHHLALCERYGKKRPELHTLYDDKYLEKWKEWWEVNEYLSLGIPTNTVSHDNVRIMYSNPFDNIITIKKNGKTITEKSENRPCDKCQQVDLGRCSGAMTIKQGRWFFMDERVMECEQCGGKFGGGSMSRLRGSGLIDYLRKSKKDCGRKWETEYWIDAIRKWEDWEEEFKVGLVNKWIELYRSKEKECMICEKKYSNAKGVKQHVRKDIGYYEEMEKVVKEIPCGN